MKSKKAFNVEPFHAVKLGVARTLLFSIAINLLMLATPLYMLQIYDRVLSSRSLDTLYLITLIVIGALLAMAMLDRVRADMLQRLGIWLEKALAPRLVEAGLGQTLKTGREAGLQGMRDLGTLRNFISSPAVIALLDAPWVPLYLGIIYMLHPVLGSVALAGALIILALALANGWLSKRPTEQAAELARAAQTELGAGFRNAEVVQAMAMRQALVERYGQRNSEALGCGSTAGDRASLLSASAKFVRHSLQVAMLGVGAYLALGGELSPGAIIAGSILMARALQPVEQSIGGWRQAINARSAYQRISTQLESLPDSNEFMALPRPQGELSVEGLNYLFPGTKNPLLRGVAFKAQPGEQIAILGPSGSGKSTLARIILGVIEPTAGHARLDGMDMAKWHPDDRGRYVGYLPQDVELFPGTIRDNIIKLGEEDPRKVVRAAKMAGAHELILRLPKGYDTEIGERGAGLSGGERQRIGLARALYNEPALVVLDEPNANLDQAGEQALIDALKALKDAAVTTLVIAHRPSVLATADRVLILNQGAVQAYGPRDEVIRPAPVPVRSQTAYSQNMAPMPAFQGGAK